MGDARSAHRWCGQLGAVVIVAAGVVLAGCSGGIRNPLPSIRGALPNWFASTRPAAATPGATTAAATAKWLDEDCPAVQIRTGAGSLSIAAKSRDATAMDLRYLLSFRDFARECRLEGATVRMRVGVRGRAIAGPAGAPPQINVPLRYAVVREGITPRTIVTKFRRVPLQMPPGMSNVQFTDIEDDLSFPMPPPAELQAYVVYIGFDEFGDRDKRRPAGKKGKKVRKKAKPKPR